MEKNLTTGSVFKNLVFFSLPYLLSYFLQSLYGTADLFIIGQFNSTDSITGVSIGSQVMHMITVMIVGLAMGATVTIGRSVGAQDSKAASRYIGNTVSLFLIGSVALTAVLLLLVKPIVSVMSTPVEAVDSTTAYLTICFIGIPFITAYNIISSIFRGLGDSKSPMYFIAIACVFNIALDCLFIGALGMGAAGAALGTALSQTVSVIVALAVMRKSKSGIKLTKDDFKFRRSVIGNILRIGFPISLQDGFIQISFIVITIIANRRGLNDAAAVGIVERIIGFLFLLPSSMLSAVSALGAQNMGAGKPKRAKLTLRYAILIVVAVGSAVVALVELTAPQLIALFDNSPDVVRLGTQYLRSYVTDCVFAGIHFCLSGYFCAIEKSGISFLHNSISIVFARVPLAYLASKKFPDNLFPMGWAAPIGSILSVLICLVAYIIINKKEKQKNG
ncbi:MAG: MATE family efflux transporter [Acutalibacteraceae bacterium]